MDEHTVREMINYQFELITHTKKLIKFELKKQSKREREREMELTLTAGLSEILVVGAIRRRRIGIGHRHSPRSL